MAKVSTCLWFDGTARQAAEFYVSLFKRAEISSVAGGGEGREPVMVSFFLEDTPYAALNGGPMHRHSPAASIVVTTEDQVETDRLWAALTADGGKESQCGWCVDRFGVSWQVIPRALPQYIGGADPEGAGRATQAMFKMTKIDINALKAAYTGETQ